MSDRATQVIERLERLARQAPPRLDDAEVLWSLGRRRHRRRWITGAAGGAVVVVLGAVCAAPVARLVDSPVATVTPSGSVLPDVIRQPGGWEPAFDGIPGPLSAVGLGTRSGWVSSRTALWGVSATTGESRFLDLPDAAPTPVGEPALSADGRLLAYWVTGRVDGVPIVNGEMAQDLDPVVGVAVLDLETGTRQVWEVDSEHGLSVGGMAWAGDVLWWSAGPVQMVSSSASSAKLRSRTWNARTGERDESAGDASHRPGLGDTADAPGGFVEQWRARRLTRIIGDGEPTTLRLGMPDGAPDRAGVTQPTMSTDGSRVAALLMPDASRYDEVSLTLLVGDVAGRDVQLRPLGDIKEQGVAGWRSPTEVVVVGLDDVEEGHSPRAVQAWTIDVTTGDRTELLDFSGNTPQVAAEAWAGIVVEAPAAPFAPDPRVVGLGSAVVLVLCGSLWRSIRRRRGHP